MFIEFTTRVAILGPIQCLARVHRLCFSTAHVASGSCTSKEVSTNQLLQPHLITAKCRVSLANYILQVLKLQVKLNASSFTANATNTRTYSMLMIGVCKKLEFIYFTFHCFAGNTRTYSMQRIEICKRFEFIYFSFHF